MTTDEGSSGGLARSATALGGDLVEGTVWLAGHAVLFALALLLWVGGSVALAALPPETTGSVDPGTLATAAGLAARAWVVLVVFAPAVAVAVVLGDPPAGPLGGRPATVFLPLVLGVGGIVAVALTVAPGAATGPLLALAVAVLLRRTVHWYAQHVRIGRLGRVGRTLLAAAALLPLSATLVRLETALVGRVAAVETAPTTEFAEWLLASGFPAQVAVGGATLPGDVAVLLAAAAAVPVGYLIVQWVAGLPTLLDGSSPAGRPPDGDSSPPSTLVWSGTTVGYSRRLLRRGSASPAVTLPDDRSEWKYDDPQAERAHRRAQQRDPSQAVEIGEVVPLVLEEVDYSTVPPTVMGSRNALKVFVEDVPDDLSERDTICVKVTDYGGKRTSAEAVFLSRGPCTDEDREA